MNRWNDRFLAALLTLGPVQIALAGAFIGASETNPNLILHSSNYTGTGGVVTVDICISPTVSGVADAPQPADMVVAVQNVVDRYNLLEPTIGNLRRGSDNDLNSGEIDWESALTHEVGHCVGMAHVNLASESGLSGSDRNYTKTGRGEDDSYDLGIGTDGVRGSPDDVRGDDLNLHWFLANRNDPFAIVGSVDSSNFTRDTANLPAGDTFVANGDRTVSTSIYALPETESVMQQGQSSNEDQRSLTGGDVATLLYARSGVDAIAGTADDYTVNYVYGGVRTGCDINVAFNDNETGFAVCRVGFRRISGDNWRITSANTFYNANFNWVLPTQRIPLPGADALSTTPGGTVTTTISGGSSLLSNDTDQDGAGLLMSTTTSGGPQNGTVTLASDGTFSYTHDGTGGTEDFFVYRVCVNDGMDNETNACSHQKVDITIGVGGNAPPMAQDDSAITDEDVAVVIGVLNNDSDSDGTLIAASVTVTGGPANGGTSVNPANGAITYTPASGFSGSDAFTYTVDDNEGATSNTATVTIDVTPAPPQGGTLFNDSFEAQP